MEKIVQFILTKFRSKKLKELNFFAKALTQKLVWLLIFFK